MLGKCVWCPCGDHVCFPFFELAPAAGLQSTRRRSSHALSAVCPTAVVVHEGGGMGGDHGGHYVTFVKVPNRGWHKFNDAVVTKVGLCC